MGVYIKGMEMPKEGNWRSIRIYPDGTIGRPIGFGDYALVEGAKAVPVPKHGRLIDVDALDIYRREEQAWHDYEVFPEEYLEGVKDGLHEAAKCLSTAPTIIPAEEVKES